MICIRCGNDSKYRDRTGGVCPSCRGRFAFEPKTGSPITDVGFKNAIEAVSANGKVRWGVEHLYYEVCRRVARSRLRLAAISRVILVAPVFFAVAGMSYDNFGAVGFVYGAAAGAAVGLAHWFFTRSGPRSMTAALDLYRFNTLWRSWLDAHGKPEGVITRKEKPTPKRASEPDVADYSFDRVVICDRARTVDLLLANNFHFENNCAVLTATGYPPGPFDTVRRMLRRNPRLQVFVLHDATFTGCGLAHRLANDPEWFAGLARVTDVGMRPVHAAIFPGLWIAPTDVVSGTPGISAAEQEWLSKHAFELAAIRPEQVIKRLFRAMSASPDGGDSGSGSDGGGGDGGSGASSGERDGGAEVVHDTDSFSNSASDSDGGGDSFG